MLSEIRAELIAGLWCAPMHCLPAPGPQECCPTAFQRERAGQDSGQVGKRLGCSQDLNDAVQATPGHRGAQKSAGPRCQAAAQAYICSWEAMAGNLQRRGATLGALFSRDLPAPHVDIFQHHAWQRAAPLMDRTAVPQSSRGHEGHVG